jgi:hypothetical protein
MTTENELRQALAAEAETMKWSLSMHDVVTGEVVDNLVLLDDARRRRTPLMLGAAAAVVGLIGGGSYLAAHRNSNGGRVLAGGPAASKAAASSAAGKVSSASAAVTSSGSGGFIGGAPGGPVSLTGMTLVLPKDLPKSYRLQGAWAMPVGSNNGTPPGFSSHLLILRGATASDLIMVSATKFSGDIMVATTVPGAGQTLKVHGVDAQMVDSGSSKDLIWSEGGVQYSVAVVATIADSEVVKLAESIVPAAGSASFTATAPAGYTASYDGDGNVQPAWSYNLQYSRENLDRPYDDSIGIDVRPAGNEQLDALQALGMTGATSKKITVGGLDATLTTIEQGAAAPSGAPGVESSAPSFPSTSLMWKTAEGVIINLNSQGLSDAELIAFAESISTVDEATFRAAVGDRLQSNGGYTGPDFTVPGVITFTGTTDGHAWTVKATPPGAADAPDANCTQFSLDGSGSYGSSCGSGATTDEALLRQGSSSGENGLTFAYGVVSDKIRKVVVRVADTNKDIVSVDTIAGTGGDDRRAYVIAAKQLPKDVKNFVVVGLDEKGEMVGTPTPRPAEEYPGNFGDPSAPAMPPSTAVPATMPPISGLPAVGNGPGEPAVPVATDPSKLPVFATGTLDGRSWELRKPEGLSPGGPACWFFSFAAGSVQMSCGGTADPKMNFIVVRDRRTFVIANTAADVAKVKATFKDGRVDEVVPTVKGADRVAVIGIGLNDVLVSVTAVNADGTDTTTVTGTLPGDPSLPFSFGDENSSGGGYAAVPVATTMAPAFAPTTATP